jgi:hypothetical protein
MAGLGIDMAHLPASNSGTCHCRLQNSARSKLIQGSLRLAINWAETLMDPANTSSGIPKRAGSAGATMKMEETLSGCSLAAAMAVRAPKEWATR